VVDIDSNYMRMALWEAKKGVGKTSPNPAVGALVVKKGKIVGRGYHKKAGTPHAEIHALKQAGRKAKSATLYVTLEPCNHTGRTAPCTEAILQAGIDHVVIGMPDPNPNVAGGGADYLASHGLTVVSGVLEQECREINLPFVKHATTGLPWVILKAGMSIDGRISSKPGQSTRITGEKSLQRVHALRDQADAILIGIGTAMIDDPSLTTRLSGRSSGKDPLRVILDTELQLPPAAKILTQESTAPTWIFCRAEADGKKRQELEQAGAVVKSVPAAKGMLDLQAVLALLGQSQITSLLVEGGSAVHGSFLQAEQADQLFLFIAPKFLGAQGVPLATFPGMKKGKNMPEFRIVKTRKYGDEILIEGRFFK
jgi:diaminohydroxyphosphoribosylaminopyrimidine deaminase/5-amino-6-(5-phosphoribosylamino)uracil reductase